VTKVEAFILDPHGGIDRLLTTPVVVWRKSRGTHPDFASAIMDEDKNIGVKPAEK